MILYKFLELNYFYSQINIIYSNTIKVIIKSCHFQHMLNNQHEKQS